MTRVLKTHRRLTRQAIRRHRATFINQRPRIYNRMTAAREWERLYAERGDEVLAVTDFGAVWKRGAV
jgi:hypothetical protein